MTTNTTIVKANPTALSTACGITVESNTKGVPGQFDKLIELINKLPEDQDCFIEAGLLKGVFKALGENSKDADTFKGVLALKGWSLVKVAEDWTIYKGNGTGIVITKNTYTFSDKVYPLVMYTGEVKLPTVIQLGVVYSEVSVGTDQGVKECKFLHTPAGVVTLKGKHFNSVAELEEAVKAAFKLETQEVSEATQEPEEVQMKPKTFCQMMKSEWIPSRETWVAQTLINKMRATWTSGKYPTCERQKAFMKAFVAQVAILPQGVEMPARAFLTAYDMAVEQLTGVKIETPKFVSSMTGEDAAANFEGEHTVGIVTQTITKVFKPVALPEHLKKCEVKDLPKPEARSMLEILLDKASKSVQELTGDSWDMKDFSNLESICESFDGEEQYQYHINMIRMWIDNNQEETQGVGPQEKPCEEDEELSEGKVTIKTMLGDTYTIEVLYNVDKTLWVNTRSGESFGSLYDLCMVHDKEYLNHSFFVNGQLVGSK